LESSKGFIRACEVSGYIPEVSAQRLWKDKDVLEIHGGMNQEKWRAIVELMMSFLES
jgi:hypothetical protein